ncbi:WD40-repeat-containing domain protein [Pilobolus umbonatus]|nr:WD40-repeat-containing domain protein [Pilobolus umbonatus]
MSRLTPLIQLDILSKFPFEIVIHIFSYLDLDSLLEISLVCPSWYTLVNKDVIWESLFLSRGWTHDIQSIPVTRTTGHRTQSKLYPSVPWKRMYQTRYRLEHRWRHLQCAVRMFPSKDTDAHLQGIYCCQLDALQLVTGSKDRTIKVWDWSGRCKRTLTGHSGSVLCLVYDQRVLVTGSSDHTLIVADMETDEVLSKLVGHEESVLSVQFVDKEKVISSSKDKTLRVWELKTGECVQILHGHRAAVNTVQCQYPYVVSGSGDRTLKMWSLNTGECVRTFYGHHRGVACIEYKQSTIVSGSSDHMVKVWNASTGECLHTLIGHTQLVRTLQFDISRNLIVSGSYDGQVKLWDLSKGELIGDLPKIGDKRIIHLKFDTTKIVCCSNFNKLVIYDFAN